MSSFADSATTPLVVPFLIAAGLAVVVLVGLGLRFPHLARLALRQPPRRPGRTLLIVSGLMFATLFIAASLLVDDAVVLAVKSVAVFNLGKIDEDVIARGGGGQGDLHLYAGSVGPQVIRAVAGDPQVVGVAPALVVPQVFVADVASRQVRGNVTVFALDATAAGPLGALTTTGGARASPADLGPAEIYLNHNAGLLLNARAGDTVYLVAPAWNDQRQTFTVRGVVTGGPLGDAPAVLVPLATLQQITGAGSQINHVYVANAGDGLTGVGDSDGVARRIDRAISRRLYADTIKQDGVEFALRAQDLFGRILSLYTLFALTLGLLLIFLIFVLLAAERRVEIGTVRALGMRRWQVVQALVIEGSVYDAGAALLGILAGLIVSRAIIALVSPTLTQIGFPVATALQPGSLILALGGGFVFTLGTMWAAAWSVSRITVAVALRDLPEPARTPSRWRQLAVGAAPLLAGLWLVSAALAKFDILVFSLGLSLAIAGAGLLARAAALSAVNTILALKGQGTPPLSALKGDPLLALKGQGTPPLSALKGQKTGRSDADGAGARRAIDRLTFLLVGGGLALYWSLPFDALVGLGLPRFSGGIQVFFIAGVLMILGVVLAVAPNLDLIVWPARVAMLGMRRLRHVARLAFAYPVLHRFRTAIGLSMFALVVFTMVVVACIASSVTAHYNNLPAQAAGYDIAGRPLTGSQFPPKGDGAGQVQALLQQRGFAAGQVAQVSSAQSLLLGMFPSGAANARWHLYPAAVIDGAFLQGVGLPLAARAPGFASDAAVWAAVRNQPGDVVIDTGALSPEDAAILGVTPPAPPDFPQFIAPPIVANIAGFSTPDVLDPNTLPSQFGAVAQLAQNDPAVTLTLANIALGPGRIAATPLWVGNFQGQGVTKLTIVGLVNNAAGQRYGLLGSPATFAPVASGAAASGEYDLFTVAPGADAHVVAQHLGSALFDQNFETTVLADLLLNAGGPRIFISEVLVGLVGLTLLVGMAALAVTGARAVVERRQQIGMLRALGFRRWQVQAVFLVESLLIGIAGTLIGAVLGLALCRNVFAVDFFEPLQSGLTLVVPWGELGVICAAALAAALLAAILPAWQAGRVAPADALRYE